jgi:multiple antibiotic resistance protein
VTIYSAALLLFMVMDPFGNVPLFITALKSTAEAHRLRIIVRELLIALAAMVLFLFGGQYILSALQISSSALTVAGGTVLFLIAIKMIFPTHSGSGGEQASGEPFIVPLAIPYVAGPSALSTVLLIMNREPSRWPEWLAAVVAAWLVSGLILSSSGFFAKVLGEKVLTALERLMGMLLAALSIQMIMTGLAQFLSGVKPA